MRQIILSILVIIVSSGVYAQKDSTAVRINKTPRWIVKTDIFYPIITGFKRRDYGYSLIGEYGFKGKQSLELIGQAFNRIGKSIDTTFQQERKHCWATNKITLMYKYYFGKKRPYTGFYIGGNTMLRWDILYWKTPTATGFTERKVIGRSVLPGIALGYQNYIKDHFVLGLNIGINTRIPISTLFKEGGAAAWDRFRNDRQGDGLLMLNIGYRF